MAVGGDPEGRGKHCGGLLVLPRQQTRSQNVHSHPADGGL